MAATKQISFAENDYFEPQVSSPDLDSKTLDEIIRCAQYATGASGAALVLSDGKIMSCRACSGELGPPVGTRLNTGSGFTSTCVQTAEVVRCDDTATDPRLDGSSCVELGIRSILAVPVFNDLNVAGVLEVLSSEPNRFTDRHVAALQLLGRLVETSLNYVPRVSLGIIIPEIKPRSTDSGKANRDQAKLTCLSCRRPNPHGSQFCNHCGVVLFDFLGSQDPTPGLIIPADTDKNADEGFKEICKIISGKAGSATWNEISERLLGDQQTVAPQSKLHTAATEESAKKPVEAAKTTRPAAPARADGPAGLKARLGAAVRRGLWL